MGEGLAIDPNTEGLLFSYFPQLVITEFWFLLTVPRGLKSETDPRGYLSVIKIDKSEFQVL